MSKRRLGIVVSIVVVVLVLCGLSIAAYDRLEILYLGQGRFVTFFNWWSDIDSCGRVFQVREHLILLAYDGCMVEFCDEPTRNEYRAIVADNGDLIGLLDYELNSPLIIMYDFSSGQCWPCNATDAQRDDLFDRLKRDNPELQRPSYWQD